ncbi:MAG: amylo-alpha-1,6-glucosidase, partial [Candidatus Omnitrophota bacterium]
MAEVEARFGDEISASKCNSLAEKVKRSFNEKFWNESEGCLYDVIEGDPHQGAIRPNMIFAISHADDLLSPERQASVFNVVTKDLLTPYGLRTLSPKDSRYQKYYHTDWVQEDKDQAYHQGTVWPWLIGPYIDALVSICRYEGQSVAEIKKETRKLLTPLVKFLVANPYCYPFCSLPEVFDGEQREDGLRHPGGTRSQAWSVAEVLRILFEYKIIDMKESSEQPTRNYPATVDPLALIQVPDYQQAPDIQARVAIKDDSINIEYKDAGRLTSQEESLFLKCLKDAFIGLANAPPELKLSLYISYNLAQVAAVEDGRLEINRLLLNTQNLTEEDLDALRTALTREILSHELKHLLNPELTEKAIRKGSIKNFTNNPQILEALLYLHRNQINGIRLDSDWPFDDNESRILENILQAYQFGYLHGGSDSMEKSMLDSVLLPLTRDLYLRYCTQSTLPDNLLNVVTKGHMVLTGQGAHYFVFKDPGNKIVVKYIKTKYSVASDIPPGDHRFPVQRWDIDYGALYNSERKDQLHPALWEDIKSFETYGELTMGGRVYIAEETYQRLSETERKRLKRYEKIGIVQRISEPIVITPEYPGNAKIYKEQKVERVKISVMLVYPYAIPVTEQLSQALKKGDIELAMQWMNLYFDFIQGFWKRGIFHTDMALFNVGIKKPESEKHLVIIDHHHWPTDFSTGFPREGTEETIDKELKNTRGGFSWALSLVQEKIRKMGAEGERLMEPVNRSLEVFNKKAAEVFSLDSFRRYWKPFTSNVISLSQKQAIRSHPLFDMLLQVYRGQYSYVQMDRPLRVEGSLHIKAGLKEYEGKPLVVVINPTVQSSWRGKEWGNISLPANLNLQEDFSYSFKDLFTG